MKKYRVTITWTDQDRRQKYEHYILPGEIQLDAIYRMAYLPNRYAVAFKVEETSDD